MFKKNFALLTLSALISFTAHAVDKPKAVNTYTLTDMRQVVSNVPECEKIFKNLESFGEKPFSVQMTKNEDGSFNVKDKKRQLKNHTHTTLKQTMHGNSVHRISTGSFDLNGEKIEYVTQFTGNTDNKDHKYLYPTMFSSRDGHCYYAGVLTPSEETVEDFKQDIKSGAVQKGTDLHQD